MNGALGTIQSEALDCEHKPKDWTDSHATGKRFAKQIFCRMKLCEAKFHAYPSFGTDSRKEHKGSLREPLCDWRDEGPTEGYFGTTSKDS